ncbi:MAG: DUF2484 family protein [Pseudomonadota bacterium]
MSAPITAACLWCALACVIGMFPSKRSHWPAAYMLMSIGAPILVWLFVTVGWLATALFVVAAASILRWPVRFAWRWLRRTVTGANV